MIELSIPDFGELRLNTLVLDFNGTCAVDGMLIPGVHERLERLADDLELVVMTADTYGTAREAMKGLPVRVQVLDGRMNEAIAKQQLVRSLKERHTAAIGNGRNDALMLEAAAIGVAVIQQEGASLNAIQSADLVVADIRYGLDLFEHPGRLLATLRS